MSYSVKEIYYTLQGEGAQTGRAAVFLRFTGCNLWSGLERDRAAAICQFCDTDFVGTNGPAGGKYNATELADVAKKIWNSGAGAETDAAPAQPLVVCTGGEPLLQLDEEAIAALHDAGFEVAIETNGTLTVPTGVDWVCVSPKAGAELIVTRGDELKLVYPQADLPPANFEALEFQHFFLQPMDTADPATRHAHLQATIRFCMRHPRWRLSLQTHKLIGID
ncbi:MAG: 7-carboxy-7-deazaguanine synthase [Planctomycetales bacterium]|nr:7-carboxy-7-deazaguanine synthase [Planctomycetales bacterium]